MLFMTGSHLWVRIIHHPKKINIIIKIWIRLLIHIICMIKYYLVISILKFKRFCSDSFQYQHDLKPCFKSVSNPSCINLFFTNQVFSFQNTVNVATGLFDFLKLVLTVLNQRKLAYWGYKNFSSNIFHF